MEYKDKAIGFAANLVPLVKNGSKKLTYRLGEKYAFLKPGDKISTKDSSTREVFGELEIIEVEKTTFNDLPIDIDEHEKYASKEEQKKVFETYYPGEVKDESVVIILKFNYAEI